MRVVRALRAAALAASLACLAQAAAAQSFAAPTNVSQSASGSYLPSFALDRAGPAAGTLRIFWHDFTSAPNLIWCADSTDGTQAGFAAGAACPANATQSWSPRAASGASGLTHLVWRDATAGVEDVFHATFDGMAWSTPENVSRTAGMSRNPVIAVDPWDRPHVLWEENLGSGVRFYESHWDGTAWSPAADTGLPFAAAAFQDTLRIACDGAGVLHAAWQDGDTSLTEVFHAQRPDGGTWSAPENVSRSPGTYSVEPAIAADASDALHLAWVEQGGGAGTYAEVCMATRPSGGAWTAAQQLTSLRQPADRPALAVGADLVPRIAFSSGPIGAREIAYLATPASSPVNVSVSASVDSDRVTLLLDGDDAPWLAWQEGSPPTPEIFVAGPAAAATPVDLRVTRDRADVVLTWTGGAAPWIVTRSEAADLALPWPEVTPGGGIRSASWIDAGVAGDGRLLFYDVR